MLEIKIDQCTIGNVRMSWHLKKSVDGDVIEEGQESFGDDLEAAVVCATTAQRNFEEYGLKVKLTITSRPHRFYLNGPAMLQGGLLSSFLIAKYERHCRSSQ